MKMIQNVTVFLLFSTISLPNYAYARQNVASDCRFDSYFAGTLERVEKNQDGLLVELLAGGDSMEFLIKKNSPYLTVAEEFAKKAKDNPETEGAFLFADNVWCAFSPIYTDTVYIQEIQKTADRYTLSVCTDETSDCYTLYISSENLLFQQAGRFNKVLVSKVVPAEFTDKYEIVNINGYGAQRK